ncbi:hypothetical protein EYF80_019387 [Liparis tanakae]|uniref:Uncharacterized protein n=1 Tax=Liparis tanakae TaxID=230148 RepID=A0A4Z2HXR9_9TELE|nr:hypothetical protein EYF80_019387 [Liparis tanakae]
MITVTLTEASASTAQPGYWSREGNSRFMNVRINSGKQPSTMLCLTERIKAADGKTGNIALSHFCKKGIR